MTFPIFRPMPTTTKHHRRANRTLPPGITRVDSDLSRLHGYIVRLDWAEGRPRLKKYFGDYTYGGEKKALRAAEKWIEDRQ